MSKNRCCHYEPWDSAFQPVMGDSAALNASALMNADAAAASPDATAAANITNLAGRYHVHEVVGSVMIAEAPNGSSSTAQQAARCCPVPDPDEAHNHRFATVSGPPIPIPGGHVHEIAVRTDFYEDHFHLIIGTSQPATPLGDRHIHFLSGNTTVSDGHSHAFRANSMIDDPIGD